MTHEEIVRQHHLEQMQAYYAHLYEKFVATMGHDTLLCAALENLGAILDATIDGLDLEQRLIVAIKVMANVKAMIETHPLLQVED